MKDDSQENSVPAEILKLAEGLGGALGRALGDASTWPKYEDVKSEEIDRKILSLWETGDWYTNLCLMMAEAAVKNGHDLGPLNDIVRVKWRYDALREQRQSAPLTRCRSDAMIRGEDQPNEEEGMASAKAAKKRVPKSPARKKKPTQRRSARSGAPRPSGVGALPEWFSIPAALKELEPQGRSLSTQTLTAARRDGHLKYVKIGNRTLIPRREIERLRQEYKAFLYDQDDAGDTVDPQVMKYLARLTAAERAKPELALGKWLKYWLWA